MSLAPTSLRNRLVVGAVAVGLTFAVAFGAAAIWRVQRAEDQAVRAALMTRLELARDEVSADGSLAQDAGSPKTDLIQVIGPDGVLRSSSPALASLGPLVDLIDLRGSPPENQTRVSLGNPDIDLAVLAVPTTLVGQGTSPAGQGALVVAVDVEGFNAVTSDLLGLLIAGLVAVILAMAAGSWYLTGRALRTVTRITERAEELGPLELTAGLPVPHGDAEMARLVGALNRMLLRLDESHATELAFAADAGHRLRTPVATLRAEAELALRETDPTEMSKALERIVMDVDQLSSIVDRMLARSRARDHVPQPVLDTLSEARNRWQRQAELGDVSLSVQIQPEVTAQTWCYELLGVAEPILDNAIRHTPAGGDVDTRVALEGSPPGHLVVEISNTGPAVSPDLAPRLFDAWVSSRDASVAGGLGLWLARETARDLGGDVVLADTGVDRTTFRIQLPVVMSPTGIDAPAQASSASTSTS